MPHTPVPATTDMVLSLVCTAPVLLSRILQPGAVIRYDVKHNRLMAEAAPEVLDQIVAHMKAGRLVSTDPPLKPATVLAALEPPTPPERRKRRGRRSADLKIAS